MAENKTKPTGVDVAAHVEAIRDPERREDCRTLIRLMSRLTRCEPVMWGPTIIGFGRYHYRYASGREGDMCLLGFASRKPDLAVYVSCCEAPDRELQGQLGRHTMSKACLYIRRLSDIRLPVLEKLLRRSLADTRRRHG